MAGRTGLGRATGTGAGTMALIAVDQGRDFDFLGETAYRFLERQLQVVAQIGTPRRALGPTAATEDIAKYVT